VKVASQLAGELVDIICAEERTVTSLFKLLSHDYYTFTHVTNVCVYTLALASRLGISNHQELIALGAGAILHDVGKRKVPAEILNKRGRLTKREFSLVKAHPINGFRDLCDRPDLTWPQLMMVYQHHERLDGNGYPVGVGQDDIHPWARICAVADVYDALTSRRAYRGPIPHANVRDFLSRNAGPHLDVEMVCCWNDMLDGA
jgi:HD-GYP domain-containing protein (c-di-GMP phosphodiesterase class II)